MKYYYEIHCFFGRSNGYSIFVETEQSMSEEQLLEWCETNNKFESLGDSKYVDYTEEITKEEYETVY